MSFTLSEDKHIKQKKHFSIYWDTAAQINTVLTQRALGPFWIQQQTWDDMPECLPWEDLPKRDTILALVSMHVFRFSLLITSRKYVWMHLLPSHLKEEGVKLPGNVVYRVRIFAVKERHRAGITYMILLFLAM